MAADGATNGLLGRRERPLDQDRVAEIRATLDPTADFAEEARRSLVDLNDRCKDEIACGDLDPCRAALERFHGRLLAMDPASLKPKGLFDSRNRRLKAYRIRFDEAQRDAVSIADELEKNAEDASRRNSTLGALWHETREAIASLDAHAEAASSWLRDKPEDDDRLSGFRRRVSDLDAHSVVAIRNMPSALAAQNAEITVRDRLRQTAEALRNWRTEWSQALGLGGKKPRKVTPSISQLTESRETLLTTIASTNAELAMACTRRVEVMSRLERRTGA